MRAPQGQALVEGLVVMGVLAGLLMVVTIAWRMGADAQLISRVAHRDAMACHAIGGECQQFLTSQSPWMADPHAQIQSLTLAEGADRAGGIRRHADQPMAEVSGVSVMDRLARALGGFRDEAASSLFRLPPSHRLVRTHARSSQLDPSNSANGQGRMSSLALAVHDWSSESDAETLSRVQSGADPLPWLADAWRWSYAPVTGVLMPTLEWLGLESGSEALRSRFHQADISAFPSTTVSRGTSQ
jgi:hypothetical protein